MWGPAIGSKNRNTAALAEGKKVIASEQNVWKCLEV